MTKTINARATFTIVCLFFLPATENSYAGETQLAQEKKSNLTMPPLELSCPGKYQHHLQGVCTGSDAIFWSFTTTLVKTDRQGKLLKKVTVANHHGDLCHDDGKIYVAVNLGKFNDPQGNAKSWIYVYDASNLKEIARHSVPEVFHGAGGIGFHKGNFFVVGGLPNGVTENYVYEYDAQFKPLKRHVVTSGHTHLGIQTAAFVNGYWWFGCYGTPQITLVTDTEFQMVGRYKQDCSLGVAQGDNASMWVASGVCEPKIGCTGKIRSATANPEKGFTLQK